MGVRQTVDFQYRKKPLNIFRETNGLRKEHEYFLWGCELWTAWQRNEILESKQKTWYICEWENPLCLKIMRMHQNRDLLDFGHCVDFQVTQSAL